MSILLFAAAAITDISHLSLVCTGTAAVEGDGAGGRNLVIDVEIIDREGRVRLPREMRPTISNGSGGWFDLSDLYINDRTIEGEVKLGPFDKTGIVIDRATGMLETRSGFRAQCEPVKSNARKF